MADMGECSIDAIVCDPPYGLEFMGKEWDRLEVARANRSNRPNQSRPEGESGDSPKFNLPSPSLDLELVSQHKMQAWHERWAREAFRVLRPGGHLLAFGGTRTYHRLVCAVEDAGFEVRDTIAWMYGSGFPKSRDIGKDIDRDAGAEREVLRARSYEMTDGGGYSGNLNTSKPRSESSEVTAPATPEAQRWQGWGTALKPAHEPIVLARKPFKGTVAANVLANGTGAMNIDACRIPVSDEITTPQSDPTQRTGEVGRAHTYSRIDKADFNERQRVAVERANSMGRWPANVLLAHDEDCVRLGTMRVKGNSPSVPEPAQNSPTGKVYGYQFGEGRTGRMSQGFEDEDGMETVERWACVPGCPVRALDDQSGAAGGGGSTFDGGRSSGSSLDLGISRRVPTIYQDAGGASRFFYTAKTSRMERNAGLESVLDSKICLCPDPKDPADSPPRATSGRIAEDGSDSSTVGSGSSTTDPSQMASKSITSMDSRPTTGSKTSSWSPPSSTSAPTPPTTAERQTEAGSGIAPSAEAGSLPTPSTSTSAPKDGSSMADADRATSRVSSRTSSSAPNVCPDCGGVIKGGLNVHPLADCETDRADAVADQAGDAAGRHGAGPVRRQRLNWLCCGA